MEPRYRTREAYCHSISVPHSSLPSLTHSSLSSLFSLSLSLQETNDRDDNGHRQPKGSDSTETISNNQVDIGGNCTGQIERCSGADTNLQKDYGSRSVQCKLQGSLISPFLLP